MILLVFLWETHVFFFGGKWRVNLVGYELKMVGFWWVFDLMGVL